MLDKIKSLIKTSIAKLFVKSIDYNTWIFSSSFNTNFNYNSKSLFEYVLNNIKDIDPLFVINDDELRDALNIKYGGEYFIETKSIKGINKVLNSGVWFTSAGLPVYGLRLNKKRIVVNLWHGVPLKKIALQENSLNKITKMYFKQIFSNNYTYILTTSKNIVPIMQKSFNVAEDKIKVWGQPRNDAIFKKNNRSDILCDLYGQLPTYQNIILYAPTYRQGVKTVFFPFEDFNKDELKNFLNEKELIIFIRCHQSENQSILTEYGDRVRLINADLVDEITDIINIFDLLITDYSSIFIDYLVTKKPIIFLPYDKENYLRQRGLNFEYDEVTPGPKPNTFIDFKKEIDRLINDNEYYLNDRKKTNLYFNDIRYECSSKICFLIKENIKNIK